MNSFVSKATDQSFIDSSNVNDISEPNLISSTNANLNHTITSIVQKEVLKDSDNGETKTKDLKGHQASVLLLDEKISILKKNDYEQSQDVFESIITISEKHPELINQVIKKFQSMENAQTALHELFFNAFRIKNIIFCWALFKCNLQESDSREKLMWDENFLNVLKYLVDKGQNISELIKDIDFTKVLWNFRESQSHKSDQQTIDKSKDIFIKMMKLCGTNKLPLYCYATPPIFHILLSLSQFGKIEKSHIDYVKEIFGNDHKISHEAYTHSGAVGLNFFENISDDNTLFDYLNLLDDEAVKHAWSQFKSSLKLKLIDLCSGKNQAPEFLKNVNPLERKKIIKDRIKCIFDDLKHQNEINPDELLELTSSLNDNRYIESLFDVMNDSQIEYLLTVLKNSELTFSFIKHSLEGGYYLSLSKSLLEKSDTIGGLSQDQKSELYLLIKN